MPKYHIGQSNIHGNGIITDSDIKPGQTIFKIEGSVVTSPSGSWQQGPNWFQINHATWINPKPDSPGNFLNHCCRPNAAVKQTNIVISMKLIQIGEEIVIDYSLNETHPLWHMFCSCGDKTCRRVIKPYQNLSPQRQKKYLAYTSDYILDMKLHRKLARMSKT